MSTLKRIFAEDSSNSLHETIHRQEFTELTEKVEAMADMTTVEEYQKLVSDVATLKTNTKALEEKYNKVEELENNVSDKTKVVYSRTYPGTYSNPYPVLYSSLENVTHNIDTLLKSRNQDWTDTIGISGGLVFENFDGFTPAYEFKAWWTHFNAENTHIHYVGNRVNKCQIRIPLIVEADYWGLIILSIGIDNNNCLFIADFEFHTNHPTFVWESFTISLNRLNLFFK